MSIFRLFLCTLLTLCCFDRTQAASPRRPNIVILQTDDQGFDDVGFNGNTQIKTPNMDQIAREGAVLTQFYSNETCAPTRAALLSGRHFLDSGIWGVHGGRDFLSIDETTFADEFRFNGYRTGIFGKWHVGKTSGYLPWDRGFEDAWMVDLYKYADNLMLHNGKPVPTQGWASSVTTQLALDFIDKNYEQPFLLYVPYMEPHEGNGPSDAAYTWQAPVEFSDPYAKQGFSPAMSRLYGMISHVDFQIGRILGKLSQKGIDENTIVIFMSDNGPIGSSSYGNAFDWQQRNISQLRGNKGTIFENGIRIPFAIRWKGYIRPSTSSRPIVIQDVAPTLYELAGIKAQEHSTGNDGLSFAQTLQNPSYRDDTRPLFFSVRAPYFLSSSDDKEFYLIPNRGLDRSRMTLDSIQTAIRQGRWKLVNDVGHYQLFDIESDPNERNPLNNSAIEESLKQEMKTWWDRTIASPETFNRPRFQIGRHSETFSRVLANGAVSVQGNIHLGVEDARGWKKVGDAVSILVDVKRKGQYEVRVKGSTIPPGLILKLQIGGVIVEGPASALPPLNLDFGQMDLTLSVASAPQGTFSSLEALDIEIIHEEQRYPDCAKFGGGFGSTFGCGTMQCRKSSKQWVRNSSEDYWCLISE